MSAFLIALLLASPFINYAYLWGYKEFESTIHVTNPNDARFSRDNFDPSNYAFKDDLVTTIKVMFPPGTPRSIVDDILVRKLHATVIVYKNATTVDYSFPKRALPLPELISPKPGERGDWWIRITYTRLPNSTDPNAMVVKSIEANVVQL